MRPLTSDRTERSDTGLIEGLFVCERARCEPWLNRRRDDSKRLEDIEGRRRHGGTRQGPLGRFLQVMWKARSGRQSEGQQSSRAEQLTAATSAARAGPPLLELEGLEGGGDGFAPGDPANPGHPAECALAGWL